MFLLAMRVRLFVDIGIGSDSYYSLHVLFYRFNSMRSRAVLSCPTDFTLVNPANLGTIFLSGICV